MSSLSSPSAKLVISQIKQIQNDLLNERDNHERVLDILDCLGGMKIDTDILKETNILIFVRSFKRAKYSGEVATKARALLKKWRKMSQKIEDSEKEDPPAQLKSPPEDLPPAKGEDSNIKSEENDTCTDDRNSRDDVSEAAVEDSNLTNRDDTGNEEAAGDQRQQDQIIDDDNGRNILCDICQKPPNYRDDIGMFQKCKGCGIHVHELCYCLVPTATLNPNFTCHACNAVGTEVEVNVPSKIGGSDDIGKTRQLMTVEERPMDCVLCRHNKGYHAMHPLYDTDGEDGRQYVLPQASASVGGKPRRLAWVHTLCAQTLAVQRGYLYGVDEYGHYEMNDENGIVSDDSKQNQMDVENGKESDNSSDEEVGGQKYRVGTIIYKEFKDEETGKLRFFKGEVTNFDSKMKWYKILYVEDGETEDMTESEVKQYLQKPKKAQLKKEEDAPDFVATRNFCINKQEKWDEIKEALQLKCVVCKRGDNGKLAIPIQCNAGDETEHVEFQQHHDKVQDPCRKAMHVGCELFCLSRTNLFAVFNVSPWFSSQLKLTMATY